MTTVARPRLAAAILGLAVWPAAAPAATIDWSSYLGGAMDDRAFGLAADAAGNLYLTGDTTSADFPATGGFDTAFQAPRDAFVTKVSADGSSLVFSSYLGGADGFDLGYGVAVNGTGEVFVCGETWSADFPANGGFDTTLSGANEAFVTKVSASGATIVWSSFLGGSGQDEMAAAVAVDGSDNAYLLGRTPSTDFPSMGGFDTTYGGGSSDAFVAKVNAGGGSLAWSSYLGGSSMDAPGYGIAVDGGGNVHVAGDTQSTDFPSTGGFDTAMSGPWDAFVTKIDAAGSSLAWSSYLGGIGSDYGRGLAIDGAANVYLTGDTNSLDFPAMGGFDTDRNGVAGDAFVTKVNAAGNSLAWSSYLGGSTVDAGYAIAVDTAGNAYVTGYTWSANFPANQGFDNTLGGAQDAFVTKVDASGASLAWSSYLGGSGDDHGWGVAFGGGRVAAAGWTLSVDFPSGGGLDSTLSGMDAFVTRIDPCGSCGDGCCSGAENACTGAGCDTDCPSMCGDGCCTGTETVCDAGCAGDCVPSCGDGCCTGSETECDAGCLAECATLCGDGCCSGGEDCLSCSNDCGPCVEPGPEPPPDMALPPDGTVPDGPAPDGPAPDGPLPDGAATEAATDGPAVADAGADAEAAAPEGESVYGCPCAMGASTGSAPLGWVALGLVLLRRRRPRAAY
jgi:hypothetical protein